MIQKRYEGFLSTPCLWEGDAVSGLFQFEMVSKSKNIRMTINEELRLGKYVERFVSFELEEQENIFILEENIQIQRDKLTLGELDCLFLKNNKPVHLEIIYKFYLYDPSVGNNEIECFIGPNRKDALIEKLTKLKNKQLPLLHTTECKKYLKPMRLKSEDFSQLVHFKAQLFMPLSKQHIQLKTLNTDCVFGFYMKRNEWHLFNNCKFYFPKKKDWLVIPNTNVNWLNFTNFKTIAQDYFDKKISPMCWIKLKNGELKKAFLVWW